MKCIKSFMYTYMREDMVNKVEKSTNKLLKFVKDYEAKKHIGKLVTSTLLRGSTLLIQVQLPRKHGVRAYSNRDKRVESSIMEKAASLDFVGLSAIVRNMLECIDNHSFFTRMQTNVYIIKAFVCITLFNLSFLP